MALDATARRRWFGAVVLLAALGMVVAGETVLPGRLNAAGFLVYWLVCMGLTIVAILVALRDMRAIQRRNLEQHRDLFHTTLNEIATDARAKARRANPPRPPPEPREGR